MMTLSQQLRIGFLTARDFDLIRITAIRALKARYRGTALGVLWSFANPIFMTTIYGVLFGSAFSSYYGGSTLRYVLSAFVGVVIVSYFLQATGDALVSIVGNGSLLNKIAVPAVTFPLASIFANTFQQCVTTFPAIVLVSIFSTHDVVRVLLVPVVLSAVVGIVCGFGLLLAALYVFFRDLPHIWGLCGFILWITSPVFYPVNFVAAHARAMLSLNPLGLCITALRSVTIATGPLTWQPILATLGVSALSLLVGFVAYNALKREFMDLI